MTYKQIVARMGVLSAELDKLADKRDLSAADERRVAEIRAEFDRLDATRTAKERMVDAYMSGSATYERGTANNSVDGYDRDQLSGSAPRSGVNETRGRALDAIERSGAPDHGCERITRAIEAASGDRLDTLSRWTRATSDPAYGSAFRKMIVDPTTGYTDFDQAELRAWQHVRSEARALSLTDSASGFLIPFNLDPTVILSSDGSVNPIRRMARIVTATSDVWHGVSSEGVTIGWAPEFAEASDNSPTFAQPSVAIHKMQGWVPISIEAIEDAQNIEMEVGKMFADAVEQLEAQTFVTGTGAGEPFGFVTALAGTGSEVAPITAETFTDEDVFALRRALPPRFRARAQWAGNIATYDLIRQFETGNGSLVFPELANGSLLRYPANEVSFMDDAFDPAVTDNNYLLAVGDWAQYVIADRVGTSIEFVPHVMGPNQRPTGARGWYLHRRVGADVIVGNAFRMLNIATTA